MRRGNRPSKQSLSSNSRQLADSLIGGIAETQELLDFCADRGTSCDIELITIEQINEAYERMLNLRCLVFRRLITPMSFARPDATMDDDPARNEQCANERFQPIEHNVVPA